MIEQQALCSYIHDYLAVDNFQDYCPNGLQVAGCPQIKTIVTGVTASQALLTQAQSIKCRCHFGASWVFLARGVRSYYGYETNTLSLFIATRS